VIVTLAGLAAIMNVAKLENGKVGISARNIDALAKIAPMDCFSISSTCYIFGCSDITHCAQPCIVVRADSWSNSGTC
jgi:hypothetical protein